MAEEALNALHKVYKQIDLFRLPLRSANKIFDAAITPILTYGTEIWGIFSKFDFEKWEQTPIEKVHLRFCKSLGLNRKASNFAVRGEMGRTPLQIIIIEKILKYNLYLNSKDDNTLVKQFLYISQILGKKYMNSHSYLLLDTLNFYSSQGFRKPEYLTEDSIIEFISTLTNKYKEFWKKKIESSTKLDFFRKFKHDFKAEEYLDLTPVINAKRDYAKFRTSNHKLAVEILRYKRPVIPREQRFCEFCNRDEVEDENHIIFSCKTYKDIRETLFQKIRSLLNINPKFKDDSTEILFNTSNRFAIIYTSNFISKCFIRRKSLLQP